MSKKTYDLDAKDFFWAKNAQNPFPQVAEEIDLELNKYVSGYWLLLQPAYCSSSLGQRRGYILKPDADV
jgi:hypothetical protein